MDFTNKTQVQTTTAAVVAGAAGYAFGHGWLGLSLESWTAILTDLAGVAVLIWPVVVTRAKSLKDTVGNMANTTVVTDPASAAALPANKDVVAVTPQIAAAIKAAQ